MYKAQERQQRFLPISCYVTTSLAERFPIMYDASEVFVRPESGQEVEFDIGHPLRPFW